MKERRERERERRKERRGGGEPFLNRATIESIEVFISESLDKAVKSKMQRFCKERY